MGKGLHGFTVQEAENFEAFNDWNYEQLDLGYNYRLNDIMASLGISQLNRVDEFVYKRNKIAKKLPDLDRLRYYRCYEIIGSAYPFCPN